MKIQCVDSYEGFGCKFTGKLAIVEYYGQVQERSKNQFLHGFGRGNFYDLLSEARTFVKESGYSVKCELLAIPILVVELN